jgi:hypothetical protein
MIGVSQDYRARGICALSLAGNKAFFGQARNGNNQPEGPVISRVFATEQGPKRRAKHAK